VPHGAPNGKRATLTAAEHRAHLGLHAGLDDARRRGLQQSRRADHITSDGMHTTQRGVGVFTDGGRAAGRVPAPRPVPGELLTILNISNSLGPLAASQRNARARELPRSISPSPIAWRHGKARTQAGAAGGTLHGSDLCVRA
jgi:hypothetical protein